MRNQVFRLFKYPQGKISMDIFDMIPLPLPNLTKGEFLVKQTHMSLDPAISSWLKEEKDSHLAPIQIGEIIHSYGVGQVIESLNPEFPVGSQVVGITGWSEYILGNSDMYIINPAFTPEAILSLFYFTGLTAYVGCMKLAQPKSGETLVVTGAADAVGSLVGQLAKIHGLRVVGVTESEEKCDWLLNELGFDAAIDAHSPHLETQLRSATPHGVDIFFENTGGHIQELIYHQMNPHGRVIVCNMLAEQHQHKSSHGPSWMDIYRKSLHIQGFAVSDYLDLADESNAMIADYFAQGKIKYKAHIIEGFENLPEALIQYFNAEHIGKLIVKF